ncbi:MAG: amidase, partial [Thermoleophilales bacterium]|nr:amidase [Thermoleophilales bacterium]
MNAEGLVEVAKGDVRYTLGPDHSPVATVEPGTRLRVETELNIGDVLHDVGDEFSADMVRLPFVNPVTGPIAVTGATPDHVLVCDIEAMDLVPPGFTALVPGFGPFTDW